MKHPASPTFCIIPWLEIGTTTLGHVRPCCHMSGPDALLKNENGDRFKINKNSVEEIWFSDAYRKIRSQMLEGKKPEACKKCWREEDAGLTSYRMISNDDRMFNYEPTDAPPPTVRYLDLRLGNICNLKCRTCNPVSSASWIDEWDQVQNLAKLTGDGEIFDTEGLKKLRNITWPDDPFTFDNFKTIAPTVEEIYLTGGEPMLIPKQLDFFDYLIKKGFAQNIELKYHTNLTRIQPKLLEYWSKFKNVHINCSVDAFGSLNDYIRYPSRWETINKNLHILKELKFVSLQISSTIQIYNLFHLTPLFNYAQDLGIKANIILVLQPRCFSIKTLPIHLKEKAAALLSKKDFSSLVPNYKGITDFMFSEDWSNFLPEFVAVTNKIDQSRQQNILTVAPELIDIFR